MGDGQALDQPVGPPQVTALPPVARTRVFWRRLALAGLVPVAIAAAFEQWQVLNTLLARPWANAIDYQLYRIAAGIGIHFGWSRIYDADLQRAAIVPLWSHGGVPAWWTSSQPFWTPYVTPPPVAWLAAPLNAVPEAAAATAWLWVMAAALVLTTLLIAPSLRAAPLYLVLLLVTWATALSVVTGNVAPLVGLGLIWSWRQAEAGHDILAGVFLAAASVKPQVLFAVPLLLLVAGGNRRLFLVWLAGGLILAAVSIASLQAQGVEDLLKLGHIVAGYPAQRQLSALTLAGSPVLDVLVVAALAVLAIGAVRRQRKRGLAIPYAVGLLASLLLSPYLNLEDFVLLIPAAMLLLRLRLGLWVDVLAVGLVLSATPASQGFVWPTVLVAAALLAVLTLQPGSQPEKRRFVGSLAAR